LPGSVNLPLDPFKGLAALEKRKPLPGLRRIMNLESDRKLIVFSENPLYPADLTAVIDAYKSFPEDQRPLLIIGVRWSDHTFPFVKEISKEVPSIRIEKRSVEDQGSSFDGLANGHHFADLDIVMLHTEGELNELMAAADLTILSQDRNPLEPRSPILSFEGNHENNELARSFLVQKGGAIEVNESNLYERINYAFSHGEDLMRGLEAAIGEYRNNIAPSLRLFAYLSVLGYLENATLDKLKKEDQLLPLKSA